MVTLLTLPRTPTLEPVCDAIIAAIGDLFDAAESTVEMLHPSPAITLATPALYQLVGAQYAPPSAWPAVLIGTSNLHRLPNGDNEPVGGDWLGSLDIHIWLDGEDPEQLVRSLFRYAEVVWLTLVSANEARALGGATLMGDTQIIAPYETPNQNLPQRAVVLAFDVSVSA